MLNAITIDVEEYYHAANLEPACPPRRWRSLPSRVEFSTNLVLEIMKKQDVKGTFFILGYVARRFPKLVKDIVSAGHEVASHGYRHRLAYSQLPAAYFRDISLTKQILEDITGQPIYGYRAPNFSIRTDNLWAYDELIKAGYKYDSSVYPVAHSRYNNKDKPRGPYIINRNNGSLFCFPMATLSLSLGSCNIRLPIAGGAYWRFFPKWLCSFGIRKLNKKEQLPAICYLHPWELDENQPKFTNLPWLTRYRHYGNIANFSKTFGRYLESHEFVPICEVGKKVFGEPFSKELHL